MKLKSKDIAKALGISTATVSLAINNKPGVNPRTKQEILDYIRLHENSWSSELNAINKSITMIVLIRDPNNTIKDVGNFLFNLSYQECCRVMNNNGYDVTLMYYDPQEQELSQILEQCQRKGTSGIFMWGFAVEQEQIQPLVNCKLPLLIYDHTFYCKCGDNVLIDNAGAVRMGLDYLYEMGHEKILYIANEVNYINFQQRLQSCRDYKAPDGKECPKILTAGFGLSKTYSDVMNYLDSCDEMPTAIFVENDGLCISTIQALNNRHLKVGDDISLIGIDDLPETVFIDFAYTHIRIPHQKKARLATERLIQRIESNLQVESILVYVRNELVEGDSVKRLNN